MVEVHRRRARRLVERQRADRLQQIVGLRRIQADADARRRRPLGRQQVRHVIGPGRAGKTSLRRRQIAEARLEHASDLGKHTIDGIFEIAGDVTPADFPV